MKISCIIPTCNRSRFLKETLSSVLKQTKQPEEIIVVNNGLEDLKFDAELNSRIKIVRTEARIGASAARNTGAKVAQGDYLAFLDDDDLWSRDYLENVASSISQGTDCVVSRLDKLENDKITPYKNPENKLTIKDFLTANPGVNGSNIVIKKNVFWQVGGFDESLAVSEDKSLVIELIKAGVPIRALPNNQVIYRNDVDANKLTQRADRMAQGIHGFTKKYSRLMTLKEYLFNWHKISYYRYKAGQKSAMLPFVFFALLSSPQSLFNAAAKYSIKKSPNKTAI